MPNSNSEQAAFTPGPWRYCGQDRGGCICGQVWSTAYDFQVLTCEMKNEENETEISREMLLANMRLVTAAPDMYSLIKSMVSICKKHASDDPYEDMIIEQADALLNALSNSTNE